MLRAVKQSLTMIERIKLLWKSYLVSSGINFFYLGLRASCIVRNLRVSGFSHRIFLIFESSQLSEFSTDSRLQDSSL